MTDNGVSSRVEPVVEVTPQWWWRPTEKKKNPFTMCDRCTVMDAKCGEKWAQHTAQGVSISKCDLLLVARFDIMKMTTKVLF